MHVNNHKTYITANQLWVELWNKIQTPDSNVIYCGGQAQVCSADSIFPPLTASFNVTSVRKLELLGHIKVYEHNTELAEAISVAFRIQLYAVILLKRVRKFRNCDSPLK